MAHASLLNPGDPRIAYEALLTRLAAGDRSADLSDLASRTDGPEAHRAAALLAALDGNLASAERSSASLGSPVDRLIHGVLLLAQGKAAAALPSMEEAAAEEGLPRTVQSFASFYLGIAHMALHQLAPAAASLERARALGMPDPPLQPLLIWVFQQLAIAAVLDGNLSAAADWFGRLAEIRGPEAKEARDNTAYALGLLGQERARRGDYGGAALIWERALAITPADTALRQNLAVALERAGRAEEAIRHWHELVRQLPHVVGPRRPGEGVSSQEDDLQRHVRAVAHRHLADLYLEEDEVGRAIEQLERALRVVPDDLDNRRTLASLLIDEGQSKKAIAHLQQLVAEAPESVEDRLEFALALQSSGEDGRAIEQMEKALEIQPDNPVAQQALGLALSERATRSPKANTALGDAQRAVALLSPEYEGLALIAVGAAQLARGDRKAAQKSFKQAIKGAPVKAEAATRVGEAYWLGGERDAALAAWKDAMKRAKRAPSVYTDLAQMWAMAGDADRCRECLEKLLVQPERWLWALEAVASVSRSRNLQPLLREVLRGIIGGARSGSRMALLARMMIYAGDARTASSLLSQAAIDAVEQRDGFLLNAVLKLDDRYRLLDRKSSRIVADYLDAHGYPDEIAI